MKIKNLLVTVIAVISLCACAHDTALTLDQIGSGEESSQSPAAADLASNSTVPEQTSADPTGNDPAIDSQSDAMICVYVCGCVENPGVYELPAGSRVRDALDAAGGFAPGAEENRINLAGLLSDSDMVFFPEEGEDIPDGSSDYVTPVSGTDSEQLININTADITVLCTLPGIGESKAKAIIEYREKNGGFKDISEIKNVSGIGESLYSRISSHICV